MTRPEQPLKTTGREALRKTISRTTGAVRSWLKRFRRPQKLPELTYLILKKRELADLDGEVKAAGGSMEYHDITGEDANLVAGKPAAKIKIRGISAQKELDLRNRFELRLLPREQPAGRENPGVRIEWARPEDVNELYKIETLRFPPTQRATREQFEKRLGLITDILKAVDVKTGKIIGMHMGSVAQIKNLSQFSERTVYKLKKPPLFGHHYQFISVAVHPDYENKGVGQLLIERALRVAKERKITKIFVRIVNPDGRGLVEKNGFVLDSRYNNPRKLERERVYVMPVVTGIKEKAHKEEHKMLWQMLRDLPYTKTFNEDLARIVRGLEWKYPELDLLHPSEETPQKTTKPLPPRIEAIADMIANELLFHYDERAIGTSPNFWTRRKIVTPEVFKRRIARMLSKHYSG
jgi:ribosomal protein S18 acetylase RimI-like enzyme